MARSLRIEFPGAHYHVMNRGNAGDSIFKTDRDHEKFLVYLAVLHDRFAINILSYCLMSNHYHLLIETSLANLSKALQWLNVSYAGYFNKKNKRQGHLFQGRFKAVLVDADEYLAQLSRYIHLNPVKANMVVSPQEYRWSSYADFIEVRQKPDWLDNSLLSYFGQQGKSAVQRYRTFVEDVDIDTLVNPNNLSLAQSILGDTDFVRWVQENFLSEKDEDKEVPDIRNLKPAISVEKVVKAVLAVTAVNPETIITKGSKRNQPREMAIYLARSMCQLSGVELGSYFGGISGAAITISCKQCAVKAQQDKQLRETIERIRKEILNN